MFKTRDENWRKTGKSANREHEDVVGMKRSKSVKECGSAAEEAVASVMRRKL